MEESVWLLNRALNKVTRKFTWPIPKVEDIFSKLNGATYFTTLDLRAGYHHILLYTNPLSQRQLLTHLWKVRVHKGTIWISSAPAYFQELMTGILKDFNFVIAYLDNNIIFSKTPQEHFSHIRKVWEKLQSAKFSMKMSKCNFF